MGKKNDGVSFLGRVVIVLRCICQKIKNLRPIGRAVERQKRLAGYTYAEAPTESRIAFGFGIAKILCVALLCLLLIVSLVFGNGIISYENVYYMFKDIGYMSSYLETRPASLNYSKPVQNQSFAKFKNGLAVVSDSEIKLFTSTGRATMTQGSNYTNPKIICSDLTALIYDQGRREFAICNSFVTLYSETLDYPISSADMSDDGKFVVVTKSQNYNSAVRIYDEMYNLEAEFLKNDLVISAKLSNSGDSLVVLSLDSENGNSLATLSILKMKNKKIRATVKLNGIMPYGCEFLSDDRILLLYGNGAYVYDLNGNEKCTLNFPSDVIRYVPTQYGVAVVYADSSGVNCTVNVIDKNGKLSFSRNVSGRVRDVAVSEKYVYILLDGQALRIDRSLGLTDEVSFVGDGAKIIVYNDESVTVCTSGVAYYISYD